MKCKCPNCGTKFKMKANLTQREPMALKRWEKELGNELLIWEKGQSARLTEFGSKLMWAEGQAQARLAPQIEALRSELERAFAVAFDPLAHVVMLYASHDHALGALREFALAHDDWSATHARLHLDMRFSGSVDAIRALNEGRCVMAGFHTLQNPMQGSVAEKIYKPLLKPGLHKIIGFATRTQGLMVAAGNPLNLHTLRASSTALWAPARGWCWTNCWRKTPWRPSSFPATSTPSPRTPPWPMPLLRAVRTWGWASKWRRAPTAWTLCPCWRKATTWFA